MIQTSTTHPLAIATLLPPEGQGRIGVTFCPGKCDPHAHNGAWSRDLAIDLGAIRAWGANALVSLLEEHEFDELHVKRLGDMAESAGLEWHHLPIPDMAVPGWQFERRWLYSGLRLRRLLRRGGRVVVHCRAGLGRAGTIAARLLAELGVPPVEAVSQVRRARRGAIQTEAQERHVLASRRLPAAQDEAVGRRLACLLGGALGDAFGYPVEFASLQAIHERHGAGGLREPLFEQGRLVVSDDTQMTLFTMEGLTRARQEAAASEQSLLDQIRLSYFDWLESQGLPAPGSGHASRLLKHAALYVMRAPGKTCLAALRQGGNGSPERPINDRKGSGGVMRVAPVALLANVAPEQAFRLAARAAALTHGHPSGYLSAGLLAAALGHLLQGAPLQSALLRAVELARNWPGHEDVLTLLQAALDAGVRPHGGLPKTLGHGWVGAEALAIAVYAVSRSQDFREVLVLAANHDGDSDTTASLAGQLFAAQYGIEALPHDWIRRLDVFDALCDLLDWTLPQWLGAASRPLAAGATDDR